MILRRPRTLLWQLGLGLMLVQAAAILVPAWYAYSHFQEFHEDQTLRALARTTSLLAEKYAASLSRESTAQLQQSVQADGARTGERITVILPDGRVIADSMSDPATMENHSDRPEFILALRDGTGTSRRTSSTIHEPSAYFALRIGVAANPLAVVRTSFTLIAADAEAAHLVQLVATIGAISLLATLAVIYLVSRQLSGTISSMAQSAGRFAAGDLTHRIDRPPSRELAALADVLNHMARRLSEQIDLLRAQRNEQHAIYQSMSNGMIALDLDQRVLSLNRAAEHMLGVEEKRARGRLLQEVVREPALNRFITSAIAGDGQAVSEMRLSRGNPGSAQGLTVQLTNETLRDVRDEPVGLLVLMNDVTHLRRLESIRSDFAANVSHELRTPITNIRGYVETLQEVGVADQQQSAKFLEIIRRNTDRLASIVEDLLALARLEQPDTRSTLEKVHTPIHRVTEAVIAQFEPSAREKRIAIKSNVPAALSAEVNPHLLEQAIGNLLSNAIKYSPAGTGVAVSARSTDDNQVEIAVADQGPGIEPEHLPRLFERFYRVDKARSREMGGTGLGLAIVKHIALVHGGRIDVESRVGHGSVFRITVPGLN